MRLTWFFFFKERLLSIESKFKALGAKSALLKKGDGCSGDVKEEDYLEDCEPLAIDLDPTIEDTDQRNTSLVDKDTILPKISNVSSLGTIHILRHHIFGIFGPPSPPSSDILIGLQKLWLGLLVHSSFAPAYMAQGNMPSAMGDL